MIVCTAHFDLYHLLLLHLSPSLSHFDLSNLLFLHLSCSFPPPLYFFPPVPLCVSHSLAFSLCLSCSLLLSLFPPPCMRDGTTTRCKSLLLAAAHCNTLQHSATHCNTLQHSATHCNTLHYTAPLCCTGERNTPAPGSYQGGNRGGATAAGRWHQCQLL